MNKHLLIMSMAASTLMLASACSSNDEFSNSSSNMAQVSFSLQADGTMTTRAISDGANVDQLIYRVFDKNGNIISGLQKVTEAATDLTTGHKVTVNLAKGQTYKVAFWAQDADCQSYTLDENMNVSIDYSGENNNESRDAFFKTVEVTVIGDAQESVTLKRPFAQLNVGSSSEDWTAAVASGIDIQTSAIKVYDLADKLSILDGTVSGNVNVEYTTAAIPQETLYVDANGDGTKEAYHYLSMSYLLANDATTGYAKTVASAELVFTPSAGENIYLSQGLQNIPLQRNYRTNIVGRILTGQIDFNVITDPLYEDDYNVEVPTMVNGQKFQTLQEAINVINQSDAGTYNLSISDDATWATGVAGDGANLMFTNSNTTVNFNLNGHTLTMTGAGGLKNNATVNFVNGTIVDKTSYEYENGETAWEFTYLELQGAGKYSFKNLIFNNSVMFAADAEVDGCTFLGEATLESNAANEYAAWINKGNVTIKNSKIKSPYRGFKIADKYGDTSNLYTVEIDGCEFTNFSKKPGVAIDNTTNSGGFTPFTSITIKNSRFTDVQPGDQKAYIYETDNFVPTLDNNVVAFATAESLRGFAECVNTTNGASFLNYTIELAADIDLNNALWTPIGGTGSGSGQFRGTFDGKNHTIKNLKVVNNSVNINNSATGLFGWINTITIKNLKIDGANITGHQYTGVIAGYMESIPTCVIENCHVNNAVVRCTYGNSDADGDKCGGIAGFGLNGGSLIKDCTVSNTNIKAGRDAGQIVGCAKTAHVESCSATNVTVEWTHEENTTGANINNALIGRVID